MFFNIYSIPLFLSSLAMIIIARLVKENKKFNGHIYFSITLFFIAWYSFFYALEISTTRLEWAILFYKIEFLTLSYISLLFFLFALSYSGRIKKIPNLIILVLFLEPTIAIIFNWSNEFHNLFYTDAKMDELGSFPFFSFEPNIFYLIHQVYDAIMMIGAFLIFVQLLIQSPRQFRNQHILLTLGLIFPFIAFIVPMVGILPYGVDAVPFALTLNLIVMYIGLNYYNLFDLVPQARALLFDQMAEGMFVIDTEGRVIDFNQSISKMIPEMRDCIGRQVTELLEDWEEIIDTINMNLVDTSLDFSRTKNHTIIWYQIETQSFYNIRNNSLLGKIVTIRNITDAKLAEERIRDQNLELEKLNQEKDKFFSIIAHDLRSPFNGFLGLTQILANEIDELNVDEIKDMVLGMRKASVNLYELLENLLEWATIQNSNRNLKREKVDLNSLIQESLYSLELVYTSKSINIVNEVPEGINILVDKKMILSVLRNIISNSLKYTNRFGSVTIQSFVKSNNESTCIRKDLNTNNSFIEIKITDTGVGMDEKLIPKLFLINEKTSNPGTEGEPSTGLGLILSKEFIDKHNGRIHVESKLGKGTEITISIPYDGS
ncbi:sensor histidine kinase [Leptospira sp. GIMC2001]|uniref:sensor histidine kinase n=1 Tax=Leptospira sp. GIMC2001 TaxID=1513297 RepID=UPI002348F23F|nr:histidine kinase N-terminal 7TM domain-containing protein [Leptospira sp. GIMC2001]WCL50470.1 ATP-binding protein [Leptospira sp. GIMC2001]